MSTLRRNVYIERRRYYGLFAIFMYTIFNRKHFYDKYDNDYRIKPIDDPLIIETFPPSVRPHISRIMFLLAFVMSIGGISLIIEAVSLLRFNSVVNDNAGAPSHVSSAQYPPVTVNPLEKLAKSGFSFDEKSFARSIDAGRTDITAHFLDANFPPLTPIKINDSYQYSAIHYALVRNAPNICALITLYREHDIDLTTSAATDLLEPVTLLDLAIGTRNKAAVDCLKPLFNDRTSYINALTQKISLMKLLDVPYPQDQKPLKDAIPDCFNKIKFLVTRPEAFIQFYSGDENKSMTMPSDFCLFRDVADVKYYLSTIAADQWEIMENYIFARIQTGHDDYKTLGKNLSLSVSIDMNEQILKSLKNR